MQYSMVGFFSVIPKIAHILTCIILQSHSIEFKEVKCREKSFKFTILNIHIFVA